MCIARSFLVGRNGEDADVQDDEQQSHGESRVASWPTMRCRDIDSFMHPHGAHKSEIFLVLRHMSWFRLL